MVERITERKREAEPRETVYDQVVRIDNERRKQREEGQVIIKGSEVPWEQGRQGLLKYYCYDRTWDKLGAPGWRLFINRVVKHSGKHIHQGGLAIFVLNGKGYTVVDGVRYDWAEDDLILLPVKPGGCEHQHFNESPDKPAEWMAFIFTPMRSPAENGITQKEDHPDWMGPRK
ncbi:MAG: cupin domain-containing protein [Chloroflexi bacterium]|nr:cupin domain-containing protein [Chloroflexota bacterium]